MDKRKHYLLQVDTETANTFEEDGRLFTANGLVYDIGFAVVDIHGNIYEEYSYVNSDVFLDMKDVMESAYYKDKIPLYWKGIWNKEHIVADTMTIRNKMFEVMRKWGITEVVAHNARFDTQVLNSTVRYITKSKFRYWFPYGTEVWDTMLMAQSVICKMPSYRYFCETYGYMTKNGQVRKTAEVLYRFLTWNHDFEESHTGLEDVRIEAKILGYCFKQKKKMRKVLYEGKK